MSGTRGKHQAGGSGGAAGLRTGPAGGGSRGVRAGLVLPRGVRSSACGVRACCGLWVASLRPVAVPCSLFCCARNLSLPCGARFPAPSSMDPTALHTPIPALCSYRARVSAPAVPLSPRSAPWCPHPSLCREQLEMSVGEHPSP